MLLFYSNLWGKNIWVSCKPEWHPPTGSLELCDPAYQQPLPSRHLPRRSLGALCGRNPLYISGIRLAGRKLGGASRPSTDWPGRKAVLLPSPCPGDLAGVLRGPRRYGAGTRVRAALDGRSLLLLIPSGDPLWKSMAEALPGVFLGYRLIAGLTIRGPSGKGRWICIRSSLRRGFCLGPLLEVTSISLLTGRIWSFLRETCVGIPWRKSLGPLWSRGFCVWAFSSGSVSSRAAKIVSFLEPFFS